MPQSRFVLPNGARAFLTARQLVMLQRIAAGDSNREAAAALSITVKTAKNYLYEVFQVLGVHSRTQAVTVAMHAGIVFPPLPNHAIDRPTYEQRLRAATRKRASNTDRANTLIG